MPNNNPQPYQFAGVVSGDALKVLNSTFEQCLIATATPVQATNPTAAADLQSGTIKAGTLTTVGQSIELWAMGITNLTTTTAALTIAVKLGSVTLATFTTGNVAVGALNLPWSLFLVMTVASVDSGGNVTLECHGTLSQNLTTVAAAATSYNDSNIAASSAVAGASDQLLKLTALISAGNAASFVNQRQLKVDLSN